MNFTDPNPPCVVNVLVQSDDMFGAEEEKIWADLGCLRGSFPCCVADLMISFTDPSGFSLHDFHIAAETYLGFKITCSGGE